MELKLMMKKFRQKYQVTRLILLVTTFKQPAFRATTGDDDTIASFNLCTEPACGLECQQRWRCSTFFLDW